MSHAKQAATNTRRAALDAAQRLAQETPRDTDKETVRRAVARCTRSFQVDIAATLGVPTHRLNTYLTNDN